MKLWENVPNFHRNGLIRVSSVDKLWLQSVLNEYGNHET